MTLPTFLGIGIAKAGTTWLVELLAQHPQVYLPTHVKDIRYFNHFYDEGPDWYQTFFPTDDEARRYRAIGEVTAHYFSSEEAPQRIAADLDNPKLILMLRNPVDRLWSNYRHVVRLRNYQGSFEEFIEDYPGVFGQSFYARHLSRYQAFFGPDQLLTLIYEQVFQDISAARKVLAHHLDIDVALFPEDAGHKVVNKGFVPRNRTLYALVARGAQTAQNYRLHWPVYVAKKMGLKRLISAPGEEPMRMSPETRHRLGLQFEDEITGVESMLQTDLSCWRA